jgi:hypothetical protein
MTMVKSYEEFVNESAILEKKTFSAAFIAKYDLNKNSVNLLKKWSFKINELDFKSFDSEYYLNEPYFNKFLTGTINDTSDTLSVMCGSLKLGIIIDARDNNNAPKFETFNQKLMFSIDRGTFAKTIGVNPDKIAGFIELLNLLFQTFQTDIYQFIGELTGVETLYVIKAGDISPATGKTQHGWSIYDSPDSFLGVSEYRNVYFGINPDAKVKTTVKNGHEIISYFQKFKIVDDQTHKIINPREEIIEIIPCTKEDFIALSKRRGAKIPIGPYEKQPGTFNFCLYSIK